MEDQVNDNRVTVFDQTQFGHDGIRRYALVVVSGASITTVGMGLWMVRQWLPVVGYVALGGTIILLLCAIAFPVVALTRYITRADWHDMTAYGSVARDLFGRTRIYAPMTANLTKITQRKHKVTVTSVVPSILELIDSGVISLGQLAMHMGFEQTRGGLIPVIDKWPGTFAIAGMGRSGKTRRVLTIIIQAIMGRARVFVCDPHRTKRDGLAKMLQPLAPWLTIARGHEEIMQITRSFRAEMKNRVQTEKEGDEYWTPWVIIFDEWSFLMTSSDIEDEDKAILTEVVCDCSTQYAGYNGFSGIIGQIWTNDATGGTAIRRSMHKVFVHQLSSEYAKFFVKGRWANKAEELEPRQCLYRLGSEVKQIITHDVPDNTADWIASYLMEHMPPDELPQVEGTRLGGTLPETHAMRMIASHAETSENAETHGETPDTETLEMAKCFSEEKLSTIRQMREEGYNQSSIIQAVWQVKPGGTIAYQQALSEYKQMLEYIMRGA